MTLAGRIAAALVALAVLGPLAMLAWQAGGLAGLRAADLAAIRFTVLQAAASALVSGALAVPLARALARRRFAGRGALVALMGAPFLLPAIVATMGLVALFGRAGWVNAGMAALGLPPVSVYGWHGVILAHVFFNLPLATRMLLHGWQAIPAERMRLAAALGFGPGAMFRHLEAPMLRAVLPGALLAIFLVCLTSFAVALTMGGGPRASTIELAIYQTFRFDFDLGRVAMLGLVQVGLCLGALGLARAVTAPPAFGAGLDRPPLPAWPGAGRAVLDAAVIAAGAAFLILPLLTIALRGLPHLADLPPQVWRAAALSLAVALGATALTLALALALALAPSRLAEAAAMLPLSASGLAMGAGLFLIVRPVLSPADLALPATLLVNAVLTLPFAARVLIPEARALEADYGRLAAALGMRGLARLRLLTLPRLRRPLGFAAGISAAFAMGDLGVIALFSDGRTETLPLALYRLMGAYRMDLAAACACLLMALSFGLFWIFARGGHARAS